MKMQGGVDDLAGNCFKLSPDLNSLWPRVVMWSENLTWFGQPRRSLESPVMPLRNDFFTAFMLLTTSVCGLTARTAQAGPLIDWLFHHKQAKAVPAYPVGAPYPVTAGYVPYTAGYVPAVVPTAVPSVASVAPAIVPYTTGYAPVAAQVSPYTSGYTPYGVAYSPYSAGRYFAGYGAAIPAYTPPTYGTYYGAARPIVGANGYGYLTQRPVNEVITTAPAVMPSTAPVTLVPDYRTTASRTPVTYYRPIMTTDPVTGAQVVTLAPCSSYEYQAQRVPTMGLTQVYNGGATLPTIPTLPATATPTYTLPRGGVPLAGPVPSTQPYATAYGTYAAPTTSYISPVAPTTSSVITPAAPYSSGYAGYASNYGNYSTLQPTAGAPSGTYPTAPYGSGSTGSSTYLGAGSTGGCTGSYLGTGQASTVPLSVPGTAPYSAAPYAIPQGQSNVAPSLPPLQSTAPSAGSVYPSLPGYQTPPVYQSQPVYPSTPSSTSPVLPPSGSSSADPAAGAQPGLPLQSSARLDSKPQLQNVVQQPAPASRSYTATPSAPAAAGSTTTNAPASSGLLPIPVPDDFKHQPRWNPGLLKEKDPTAAAARVDSAVSRTALQSAPSIDPNSAWGSKPIHWASFKEPVEAGLELSAPQSQLRDKRVQPAELPTLVKEAQPALNREVKMVPLPAARQIAPTTSAETSSRLELGDSQPTSASSQSLNRSRYNIDGWQSAK